MTRGLVSIVIWVVGLVAIFALAPVTARGQGQPEVGRGAPFPRQLTVYDRRGNAVRMLGEPEIYRDPVFSPDGMRLAVVKVGLEGEADVDIWVFDLPQGTSTRVTSDPAREFGEFAPVWSPDASQIGYYSYRDNYGRLYRKASNGAGSEELLYQHTPGAEMHLRDWSPDGRFLSFDSGNVVYTLPLDGQRKAIEFSREEFELLEAHFSPDGRFLAYRSNESGRYELYVQSIDLSSGLPAAGGKWQVSNRGALGMVHWRGDGSELYYLAADGAVMAVEVTTTPAFEAGPQKVLFRAPSTIPLTSYWSYPEELPSALGSVSRNGERFIFAVPLPPDREEITVEPETLAKYVGTYARSRNYDWVVNLESGQLLIQEVGAEQYPLFAESETSFFFKVTNGDLEFIEDEKGNVTDLVLYGGVGRSIRMPRK